MHGIARAVNDAHPFARHRRNRRINDPNIAPLANIRNDFKKRHRPCGLADEREVDGGG
jgi:hypothetical protein